MTDASLGTGGNQTVNSASGKIIGGSRTGTWEPTVLYLLGLLIVEWVAFIFITKFI